MQQWLIEKQLWIMVVGEVPSTSTACSVSLSVCVLIAHFWAKCRGQILVEKHAGGHNLFIYECICSSAASLNL